jgi:hypothetical protein
MIEEPVPESVEALQVDPIIVTGGSIEIDVPSGFNEVPNLPPGKKKFKHSGAEARITGVEITGVTGGASVSFVPIDGKCKITITYEA